MMWCLSLVSVMFGKIKEPLPSFVLARLLVISGLLILVVPLFAIYLETIAFLSVIAIILFLPVFIGIRSWVGYKFFGRR